MKKSAISILVLTLTALYSITPLLMNQEFFSGGWDLSTHISRSFQVSMGIKEGVIYPRWLSLSNGGYGSPEIIFYSPLFYWITGVVNLFIPSLIVSLKVTTFAAFLLSGMSMYIFLRNFCNNAGSIAGGIAYQLLPYRVFDLYMRETLAETLAFVWLPLILHFSYKACADGKIFNWMGVAFSYAGLVLTHLVSAYIFTFVIAAVAVSLSIRKKSSKILLKFIIAGLLGISLSAFYFIPMFFERKFVHIEWIKETWGYARSFLYMNENSLNPFYIRLEEIVTLNLFLVITTLTLFYYKRRISGSFPHLYQILFYSSVFAFSLFMSIPISKPIWEFMPGLSTIVYPWRWQMASTLSSSVLIALTFHNFSIADIKRDRFVRICMAFFHAFLIAFLIGSLYLSSIYVMSAKPMQKEDMNRIIRKGDVPAFRPVWLVDKEKDFSKEKWIPVTFKEGMGTVDILKWNSESRFFKANASSPSTLRISTFYYPGWTALINGREVKIDIEKDCGAMLLNIPPGKSGVLLEFRDTPLRRSAKWISIISLFAALTGLIVPRFKRPL